MSDTERSTTRRELVEAKLVETAAQLFATKGFGATSLQDVAEALEMSRPSLYHYVSSKDDLLARIVAGIAEGGERAVAEAAEAPDLEPPERLRRMARGLCLEVAGSPNQFRLLLNSEANLPEALMARMVEGKRTVTNRLTAVIAEGVERGQFRPVDSQLAALAILGMCNWVAFWYTPGLRFSAEAIADAVGEQAVRSVVDHAAEPHNGDPRTVVRAIRSSLDALDGMLPDRG